MTFFCLSVLKACHSTSPEASLHTFQSTYNVCPAPTFQSVYKASPTFRSPPKTCGPTFQSAYKASPTFRSPPKACPHYSEIHTYASEVKSWKRKRGRDCDYDKRNISVVLWRWYFVTVMLATVKPSKWLLPHIYTEPLIQCLLAENTVLRNIMITYNTIYEPMLLIWHI
jgi:hypothetical protein